jgi:hypothetical protein
MIIFIKINFTMSLRPEGTTGDKPAAQMIGDINGDISMVHSTMVYLNERMNILEKIAQNLTQNLTQNIQMINSTNTRAT